MIGRIAVTILGAIIGSFSTMASVVFFFGWGVPGQGKASHIDPTRADYIDLLLTVVTIFLGAIGLAVTVGALVIGLVALKTLREIKDEAASAAKVAAADKIDRKIDEDLAPKVKAKVQDALPMALQVALLNDGLGHNLLSEMAKRGELDEVLERVVVRMQAGGPELDTENADRDTDGEHKT